MSLIRSRYQSYSGGSSWFNSQLLPGEPTFNEVFSSVWRIFFTPSKPIKEKISKELDRLHLVPGEYAAAHLRALYAIKARPKHMIRNWARNALNCASTLRPGQPIFFASDSSDAVSSAKLYATEKQAQIVSRDHDPDPPLHLDKPKDWKTRPVSDFYDTFIDLYLLALSKCVTYNQGGFGHWGLLIGGDISCVIEQKDNVCGWVDGGDDAHGQGKERNDIEKQPLYLEAME
jgi:hypothetical protein